MIYRKSLNSGATEWRTATVIPIFKKKKKSAAENYRLVSLTCVSCKVLESILKDDIMVHLHNNQLIKVPTERLLRKVQSHGISGRIGNWIQAWIDRKQQGSINGKLSGWRKVLSRVPVLFLLVINNLDMETTEKQIIIKICR